MKKSSQQYQGILKSGSGYHWTFRVWGAQRKTWEEQPTLPDRPEVLWDRYVSWIWPKVLPHVRDAWVDESKTKIGYVINFNRYFYEDTPPRSLEEIESDLKKIEAEIQALW